MSADIPLWHAMHDECGPIGCGGCVVIPLDFTAEELQEMEVAAKIHGLTLGEFVHYAVREGMRAEGYVP